MASFQGVIKPQIICTFMVILYDKGVGEKCIGCKVSGGTWLHQVAHSIDCNISGGTWYRWQSVSWHFVVSGCTLLCQMDLHIGGEV